MGAIRDIAKNISGEDAAAQAQRETINALANLASAKAETYGVKIDKSIREAGTGENKTVKTTIELARVTEIHAYSSKSAENIKGTIEKVINGFLQPSGVTNGIIEVLKTSVEALYGEAESGYNEFSRYWVMTEGKSIVRVDVRGWKQHVKALGLSSYVEQVSAFVAVKSSVEVEALRLNDFLNLYQQFLVQLPTDEVVDIRKEVAKAAEIYQLLSGKTDLTEEYDQGD